MIGFLHPALQEELFTWAAAGGATTLRPAKATRFALNGWPTVTVAAAGDTLRIEVADKGPGIPADQIARVTQPFYRIEESRNRETGGSGLGLAITKAIAESHGGALVLEDTGQGLRACIMLPGLESAPPDRR